MSAAHIPCVVSKNDAYACVTHQKNGLIAKKDMDFKRQIKRLIDNPDLRQEISDNAYAYVKENYSYAKLASDWANYYRSIVDDRNLGKL